MLKVSITNAKVYLIICHKRLEVFKYFSHHNSKISETSKIYNSQFGNIVIQN